MMLSLTTGERLQTLHDINVYNIDINCDFIKIRFGDLLKISTHKKRLSEVFIVQYPDNENIDTVYR